MNPFALLLLSRKQWLIFTLAGLLACSTFWGLPIPIYRDSGKG